MFLISTKGKTLEQVAKEGWKAYQKFQRIYKKSLEKLKLKK